MIEQRGPAWDSDFYGSGSLIPGSWESNPEDFDCDESSGPQNGNQRLSFETLLETICERLQDTKQQGSLKRIRQLEEILDTVERDLDKVLSRGLSAGRA